MCSWRIWDFNVLCAASDLCEARRRVTCVCVFVVYAAAFAQERPKTECYLQRPDPCGGASATFTLVGVAVQVGIATRN